VSAATVLVAAAALSACGLLAAAWRPGVTGAAAGIPALAAGLGLAGVGVSRYTTVSGAAAGGQELAVVAAVAGFALVVLVTGLAGRAVRPGPGGEPRRRPGRRR
jgi:hypothetical protein